MKKLLYLLDSVWLSFIMICPNTYFFCRLRAKYYAKRGAYVGKTALISQNVVIKGKFSIGENSSIAQNCSITGESAGVTIGNYVMIAPSVVIVAFNHGTSRVDIPMLEQPNVEKPIYIEDDVWIGANSTIGSGVRIGKGSIVGANSFVNKDVPPYSIVGGVPMSIIKSRIPL